MNKKFLLVFICIISLLTLASCHNKFEEIKEELPAKQEENVPEEVVPEEAEKEEEKFHFVEERTVELNSGTTLTLPAEDIDTKEIIIPYPEDFTFGYTEPEITPPEDFEWGEYMPFVRYSIGSYGEVGIPLYTYAFLGNGINSLDEGHTLYEKLNDKYKKTFEYSLDDTIDGFPLSVQEEAIPLVSESRVIWVSTDVSEVGNYYLENTGKSKGNTNYNGIYQIYQNEKLTSTYIQEKTYHYDDGGIFGSYTGAYTSPEIAQPYNNRLTIHNNTNSIIRTDGDINLIYDLDDNKLKYKILFDFDILNTWYGYGINQILDGRYLVITFYSDMFEEEKCHNIYLFDLETEEMTKINGYCFNPLLSPDRKYLIYSQETWRNTEVNSRNNYDYDLKHGFYIKNLENGETTFYDYNSVKYTKSTQSINWVKEENLKELIYGG